MNKRHSYIMRMEESFFKRVKRRAKSMNFTITAYFTHLANNDMQEQDGDS